MSATTFVHAKSLGSCLTLWEPMDCSPPGSSVHGILQAKKNWNELPCPPPGDLPDPGIKPAFPVAPALQVDSLLLSHQGTAECYYTELINYIGEYGREKLGRVLNYLNSSRIPFVWQLQRIIDTWQKVYKRIWGNGIMKLTREWTTSILKICWELIQFTG